MSNEYLDIAIEKVVKQEINKVLGQIRNEIEQYDRRPNHYPCDMISIGTVLEIIDKHMTEIEDEEGHTI